MKTTSILLIKLIAVSFFILQAPIAGAQEMIGCCQKTGTDNVITTENLTQKACKEINTHTTKWFPRQTADANKCVGLPSNFNERPIGQPLNFVPAVGIPDSEYQSGKAVQMQDDTGNIANYIVAILKYSIGVIAIISVVVMMLAGTIWLTSAGNSEKVSKAKSMIASSLVGIFLTLGSFVILSAINTNLTELKITPVPKIAKIDLDKMGVGCCLKKAWETKDNVSQLVTTAETTTNSVCEKAKEDIGPNGYNSVEFMINHMAQDNKCILTHGCCFVKDREGDGKMAVGDKKYAGMCVEDYPKSQCEDKDTFSNDLRSVISGGLGSILGGVIGGGLAAVGSWLYGEATGDIATEFQFGKCTNWSKCRGTAENPIQIIPGRMAQ